jgi:hypothetical protein
MKLQVMITPFSHFYTIGHIPDPVYTSPEDGGSIFLRSTGNYEPDLTTI